MPNNSRHERSPFASIGLRTFLSFCRPWRWQLALVALTFVIANVLITIQPIFLGRLVDAASQSPINSTYAWWMAIVLIALSTGHNILWRGAELLYRSLIFAISYRYETYLFREVMAKPYPYFVDKFTGKIGSYITNMSNELKWLLDNSMFSYIGSIVSVVSVVIIMSSINWQTGAIIVSALVGMLLVGRYTLGRDMRYQAIEADINSTKNGRIIDAIANFVSVKAFHREASETREIVIQQELTYQAGRRAFLWGIIFWGSMSVFVRDLMWPSIVVLNLWLLIEGQITLGQFTTVLSTALLFTSSIWEIVWNVSQFGQRVSKIEEAHTYLFGSTNIVRHSNVDETPIATPQFTSSLTIRDLSFAYPDKPDVTVLKGIDLHLVRGEKIGIVGRSGSGKSTLVKLLLDQYETSGGSFVIDEHAVSGRELSSLIAYVPQDTTLFHRSIADNIAYVADESASRDDVVRAARQAQADEFIAGLAEGYDTMVGERGVKLSGGQRQRIAIARAMLHDAPILVLDEATSALDSESEVHVQKALENLWQDKTVIAIAHRLSTLRNMDRIVVMDDGRIVETGTHNELLAAGGHYATLWQHQSGGFIEE